MTPSESLRMECPACSRPVTRLVAGTRCPYCEEDLAAWLALLELTEGEVSSSSAPARWRSGVPWPMAGMLVVVIAAGALTAGRWLGREPATRGAVVAVAEPQERRPPEAAEAAGPETLAAVRNWLEASFSQRTWQVTGRGSEVAVSGQVAIPAQRYDLERRVAEQPWCHRVDLSGVSVRYPHGFLYRVRAGDGLARIARRLWGQEEAWPRIYAANRGRMAYPEDLSPGEEIVIPGPEPNDGLPDAAAGT